MSINLSVPIKPSDLKPRIVVFGVGGAGGNAVNNMIQSNLEGVECMVANTDAQALTLSLAERCIQLGRNITQGLGAGSRPDIGRAAAEEGIDEILEQLQGCHMLFIAAGMGGGTGTGAGPVIARAARDQGILTVGVVTKPFHFEGPHRMAIAEQGLEELQQVVDTMIVIPNQNLFRVATEKTTFADAFKMADNVLYSGVRGVTDLMVMPGLINLDFADIRTVMSEMGKAMMGAGEADGQERARAAAEQAIANPLLDDVSMKGAHGVLVNITGGMDMTLFEVDEAVNRIRDEVDGNANLIFGSTFDDSLDGSIRVSIFATGIDAQAMTASRPKPIRLVATDGALSGLGDKPLEATEEDGSADEPVAPTGDTAVVSEPLYGLEIDGEVEMASDAVAEMAPEAVIGATGVEANYDTADDLWEAAADPGEVTPDDVASEDEDSGLFRALGRQESLPEPEITEPEFAETEMTIPEEDVPEMTQPTETLAEPAVSEPQDEPKRQYLAEPEELPREKVAPFPHIDSSDRLPESEEEDLLEIPAFLRRQAN